MLCKNRKSSRQNRKRSVLFVLAIAFQLSALAVLATPSEAFAQLPGEWGNYIPENDGGQNLSMTGAFSEARNGGHLLRAWRGADNQVWMSVDNGNAFTIGVTQTFVPRKIHSRCTWCTEGWGTTSACGAHGWILKATGQLPKT
jgi:hypothetical protein